MTNYLLAYRGGTMPDTEAAGQAAMAAWGAWQGSLGASLLERGGPFGASQAVSADGSTSAGPSSDLSGYSVVAADNFEAALDAAKRCPIFEMGGTVDVYETITR